MALVDYPSTTTPKKKKPAPFGAGMQDMNPLDPGGAATTGVMPDNPLAGLLGGGEAGMSMGMVPGDAPAAPNNPFASLLQGLMGGAQPGAPAAGGGVAGLAALLKQLQANKDPVGQFNNRSNLPSNAPGSTSPFATGFFGPQTIGDTGVPYKKRPVV